MKAYSGDNLVLGNVQIADTFLSRLKGLLGRKSIGIDEGLLLTSCSSIHCFFMKFTIDVVYLSDSMEVLYKETVKPWGMGKLVKNTRNILEMHEGASTNIEIGDIIKVCHSECNEESHVLSLL